MLRKNKLILLAFAVFVLTIGFIFIYRPLAKEQPQPTEPATTAGPETPTAALPAAPTAELSACQPTNNEPIAVADFAQKCAATGGAWLPACSTALIDRSICNTCYCPKDRICHPDTACQ